MTIGAIILAAGLSTRMGECKPLITIGPTTLLGHAINLFATSGIADIVVVVGHNASRVKREARRHPCRTVLNVNYTTGMFSSIQVGVKALAPAHQAFFLLPVDIPLVGRLTISTLIDELERDPSSLVLYPEHQRRRGHPPLMRTELAPAILNYDGLGGLRTLLKRYHQQSRTIAVDDPCILLDADTRYDLDLLKEYYLQGCF